MEEPLPPPVSLQMMIGMLRGELVALVEHRLLYIHVLDEETIYNKYHQPALLFCFIFSSSLAGSFCCQFISSKRSWYLTPTPPSSSPLTLSLHHLTSRDSWSAVSGRLYWKHVSQTCSALNLPVLSYNTTHGTIQIHNCMCSILALSMNDRAVSSWEKLVK